MLIHVCRLICFLVFVVSLRAANGQEAKSLSDQFKDLQANSSPAFVVLGVEPENIQRPNSPSEFVANAQSASTNGKVSPNFAIETSPYYWGKSLADDESIFDYLVNPSFGQNFFRSLTFSFATSPADSVIFLEQFHGTALGAGLHFQLISGKPGKKIKELLSQWHYRALAGQMIESMIFQLENESNSRTVENLADEFIKTSLSNNDRYQARMIKEIVLNQIKVSTLTKNDIPDLRNAAASIDSTAALALTTLNADEFPLTREGFMLEVSVADAAVTPNDRWSEIINAKTSVWLTPSYRLNLRADTEANEFLDVMAVIRYTQNRSSIDKKNYADVGLKLQWLRKRFSIAFEFIERSARERNAKVFHTNRSALTLSYMVNDFVTFKSTFGSNFDGNSIHYDKPNPSFIVGGFNFAFSELKGK